MAIYNGKHCVFEMVGLDLPTYSLNSSSNVDDNNCANNWSISDMKTTTLPSIVLFLSSALQDNLSNTTIQTAKNGNSSSLVSTTDKLFLAAEKEISTTIRYSRTEEFNTLTTWDYYVSHTQASDRVKEVSGYANNYWLRSPYSGNSAKFIYINNNGSITDGWSSNTERVAICYAF